MKPHLEKILTDLCGTPERARFWSVFSSVTLMLVPLIFALHYQPEDAGTKPTVFMIGSQLEWGLIGLAVSVVVLGYVVGSFIPRSTTKSS